MKKYFSSLSTGTRTLMIMAIICLVAVVCHVFGWTPAADASPFLFIGMTTLAADKGRIKVLGPINEIPMIASDIIYEGAAVGIVIASGHARPLTSVDKFAGFAEKKADNSTGSAAAINVRTVSAGKVVLSVSGAVITDVGQPVYATDDDTFVFTPVGGVYVGKVCRFVSSGVVEVQFDAINGVDPWEGWVCEALGAATKTLDLEDTGKAIFATVDSVITLAATAVGGIYRLVCMGPYGTVQVSASPVAGDLIAGPDTTGADDKDYVNTKATAQRGDFIELLHGSVNGPVVTGRKGTWLKES
jgi:hypothetical protein